MNAPLDPAIAALAEAAASGGPAAAPDLRALRERVRAGNALCAAGPALRTVEDIRLPVDDGTIGARIYSARAEPDRRTLVYFHGGGWVTGDLDYSDELCRFLARDGDCTVLSVDYRLAPEHPYPRPFTDAVSALRWAARTLARGGPLAVGGDSAGGNLAAACAQHARDHNGPALAFQLLIYPALDCRFDTPSYRNNADGFPVGSSAMRWFWQQYIPDTCRPAEPSVSPLRADSLADLPPAHVVVAGHDPLRDDGIHYAERLKRARVLVTLTEYDTLVHGFFRFTGAVPAARAAISEVAARVAGLFRNRLERGNRARPVGYTTAQP